MNKALKTILIISITVFGAGLLLVPSTFAQAQNLVAEFENTPLFDEANFLPGDSITRWVKVTNNSGETRPIATEAINYPGFPNSNNVPTDDLSRALLITIREKGDSDLYGGSTGEKTLFDFYQDGETYLSDVPNSVTKEYEFEISFPSEKENEWQNKTTGFDILVGFQGTEGNGGNGGGGGGGLPPGLTIFNEADKEIEETSVTITWQTNYFSTSQVIYAAEGEIFEDRSHTLDLTDSTPEPSYPSPYPPRYGYAHTTPEYDTTSKVTVHSVTIAGLSPGTIYYYRCVSHASLAVSKSHTFTTLGETAPGEEEEEEKEEEEEEEEGPVAPGEEEEEEEEEEEGPVAPGEEEEEEEEIVAEAEEEEGLDLTGFLAAIGTFFGSANFCWLFFLLIIILTVLSLLSIKKKREKRRQWILPLIILALIILYCIFCCSNCWLLILIISIMILLALLLVKKKEEA